MGWISLKTGMCNELPGGSPLMNLRHPQGGAVGHVIDYGNSLQGIEVRNSTYYNSLNIYFPLIAIEKFNMYNEFFFPKNIEFKVVGDQIFNLYFFKTRSVLQLKYFFKFALSAKIFIQAQQFENPIIICVRPMYMPTQEILQESRFFFTIESVILNAIERTQ